MRRPVPGGKLLSSQWKSALEVQERRPAMKKNSTKGKDLKGEQKLWKGPIRMGMDLGDRTSRYCVLDGSGQIVREGSVGTTKAAMTQLYGQLRRGRIALEVGTHSPWISR